MYKKILFFAAACILTSCATTKPTNDNIAMYQMEYSMGYISESEYNFLVAGESELQGMKNIK